MWHAFRGERRTLRVGIAQTGRLAQEAALLFSPSRKGPFEGPATIKPPALPGDTYCTVPNSRSAHVRHTSSDCSHSGGFEVPQYRHVRYRASLISRAPLIKLAMAFINAVSGSRRHFKTPTRRALTTGVPGFSHRTPNSPISTIESVR